MEDESLVGIVQFVDGERDPRNLMFVFSILRAVMIEWDITNHVEVYPHFTVSGVDLTVANRYYLTRCLSISP